MAQLENEDANNFTTGRNLQVVYIAFTATDLANTLIIPYNELIKDMTLI